MSSPEPSRPRLLSISAAAEYLGVSPGTLRRWESGGRIKPERTPGGNRRYRIEDLDALLAPTREEA